MTDHTQAANAAVNNEPAAQVSLSSILKTGSLSEEQIKEINATGWHIWQNSSSYTDIELEVTYQTEEENGDDRYSLNLHLTLNWDESNMYMVLGTNLGDGFNDLHHVSDDGLPFDEQLERCIDALRENEGENEFISLIDTYPDAWAEILSGANKLSCLFGVPTKETLDVSAMSREKLVKLIVSDSTVHTSILEAAHETPDQKWTVIDIHELVLDALNIDLDLDDTELFGSLISYFNELQEAPLKS